MQERLGKRGYSAGGVLTKWTVTQTNRFKAAAAGAGASSWAVMYMLGDLRQHREYWFGGPPWTSQDVLDNYWKDSPIAYVKNVTTPTLLHSGDRDERNPLWENLVRQVSCPLSKSKSRKADELKNADVPPCAQGIERSELPLRIPGARTRKLDSRKSPHACQRRLGVDGALRKWPRMGMGRATGQIHEPTDCELEPCEAFGEEQLSSYHVTEAVARCTDATYGLSWQLYVWP
jgi:hypothetical protein